MSSAPGNSDWLAHLAPEHVPQVPPVWPPAPGWWLLGIMVLAMLAAALWWWQQPQRRLRRIALRELRRIRSREADTADTARLLQSLLRRYALAAFGAERVARLSGDDWLRFIAAHGAAELAGPLGRTLLVASFGGKLAVGQIEADRAAWYAATERFVRQAAQASKPRRGQP